MMRVLRPTAVLVSASLLRLDDVMCERQVWVEVGAPNMEISTRLKCYREKMTLLFH